MKTACPPFLNWKQSTAYILLAVLAFHLAHTFHWANFLIAAYLFAFLRLAHVTTARRAFYLGLLIGLLTVAPQLGFFWTIFGFAAIALWAILAFWIGAFLLTAHGVLKVGGGRALAVAAPVLWTGFEYFRSELYYLRFSWVNVGYVFSNTPQLQEFTRLGVYGIGFAITGVLSALMLFRKAFSCWLVTVFIAALGITTNLLPKFAKDDSEARGVPVAGIQMEFPTQGAVVHLLDKLLRAQPDAELIVLSEYTFDGPVPETVLEWCREHQKFLIAGAKDELPNGDYFNTAFVIDPNGEIVFRQAKSVPIQFFKDGLPAQQQDLWDSPWGKIGIAICYDLSYRRVIDRLIQQGAQAIIVPTMDVVDWGKHQHELHARVARVRSTEYQVPIFRVCSSGISQLVNRRGFVEATAPFPGDEAIIGGILRLQQNGRLPLDHWLAPACVIVTALTLLWLIAQPWLRKQRKSDCKPPTL